VDCNAGVTPDTAVGSWVQRVYGAKLGVNGTARFGLLLEGTAPGGSIDVSGIVIAPIGAAYMDIVR
jgi:hypothetical protein